MLIDILLIIGGLALLMAGGELLVRGAASLARRIGMSSLVVGLTVVSVATSAPELAVTVDAVFTGAPDLAVGNVIGSNTANVLLILGAGALIAPLAIRRQLLRFDIPVMLVLSILLLVLGLDGGLSILDGVLLFGGYVTVTAATVMLGKRNSKALAEKVAPPTQPGWVSGLLVLAGVGLLILGAQLLVRGAVSIATDLGISELVIGLTIVAIGTSLPELAATIIAVRRGEGDMAVGNVVGSNIANIGLVLGLPTVISGGGIPVAPSSIALDLPLMIATAVVLVVVAFTGSRIVRLEGAAFVLLYAAYLTYMILDSAGHDALDGFTMAMVWFVLPLLLVVAAVTVVQELQERGERGSAAGVRG